MAAAPIFARCTDFYDGRNVFGKAARAAWELGKIVFVCLFVFICVFVFACVFLCLFVCVLVYVFVCVCV